MSICYNHLSPKSDYLVYKYENLLDGKVYIGQTTRGVRRFIEHNYELSHGVHRNCHFQNAYDKYGGENFSLEILSYADSWNTHNELLDELNDIETFWISVFNSTNRDYGYNLELGGDNKSMSSETITRMKEVTSLDKNVMWGTSLFEQYGGIDFIKDCASKGMTRTEIANKVGLNSAKEVTAYLRRRNIKWDDIYIKKEKHLSFTDKSNKSKISSSSGIMNLTKTKSNKYDQGFTWSYRYYDDEGVRRTVSRVNLFDLLDKMKSLNHDLVIVDLDKANDFLSSAGVSIDDLTDIVFLGE